MQRVDEMTEPPIVGRYYWVTSVYGPLEPFGKKYWAPVFGAHHDDEELGSKLGQHWHFDVRFAGEKFYKRLGSKPLGRVLGYSPFDQVVYRRMRCKREFPVWPGPMFGYEVLLEAGRQKIEAFRQRVERVRAGRKLCGMKCPHKGFDLSTLRPDGNGVLVCPGHGARWNAKTGELVPTKVSQ